MSKVAAAKPPEQPGSRASRRDLALVAQYIRDLSGPRPRTSDR